MPEITNIMTQAAYSVAKQVYSGAISQKVGIDKLNKDHGMNATSAAHYIHGYACMIEGRTFSRTYNSYATEYFLQEILQDGGEPALLKALTSLGLHLDYYESVSHSVSHARRRIYKKYLDRINIVEPTFPDELPSETKLIEGKGHQVLVNIYERNPAARALCLKHYGFSCSVCSFNFENRYGKIGRSYIHVHHLIEISTIAQEYSVDPIKDLRPVCPNCHSMLHRKTPAYTIEELRALLG